MAQNAPVQGSAADIFKLAMIDVDRALGAGGGPKEFHVPLAEGAKAWARASATFGTR